MHLMATLGILADTTAQVTSRLPWGWYAGLAAVDILLTWMYFRRRARRNGPRRVGVGAPPRVPRATPAGAKLQVRAARPQEVELQGTVLRDGWWIPSSRAASVPEHHSSYQWPVHRDYMVRRIP